MTSGNSFFVVAGGPGGGGGNGNVMEAPKRFALGVKKDGTLCLVGMVTFHGADSEGRPCGGSKWIELQTLQPGQFEEIDPNKPQIVFF